MTQADKETLWAKHEAGFKSQLTSDFDLQASNLMARTEGQLEGAYRMNPMAGKTAADMMADARYQKVKDDDAHRFAIDRVTLDGPRDLVGELKTKMKSGPIYDLSKRPGTEPISEIEEATLQGRNFGEPTPVKETNPVNQYLKEVLGLQSHLEENFDYAKKVESAIGGSRQHLASQLIELRARLDEII